LARNTPAITTTAIARLKASPTRLRCKRSWTCAASSKTPTGWLEIDQAVRSNADGVTLPPDENASPPLPAAVDRRTQQACFVVRDHAGQQLAYVYFEDDPGRQSAAKMLSPR
jgi:hypothetical protein